MTDPLPIHAEVKADLTKPVEDITGMAKGTHKGLGKLYYALIDPWVNNRKAQADRIAAESARNIALLKAQTDKDIQEINTGMKEYWHGRLLAINATSPADYYSQVKELNGICDAKRLEAAMLDAAIELSQIPEDEISDEPLNQTFFNHWRAEAESIDEEDLRKWWAHLLVEETKKPGSISPRTLDVAKNMSKNEAILFSQISKGVIGDILVLDSANKPLFGSYHDRLILQDAGLVVAGESQIIQTTNYETSSKKKVVAFPFFRHKLAILVDKDRITISCQMISIAGKEIYSISSAKISIDELKIIAGEISRQNQNTVVKIYQIISVLDGDRQFRIADNPIWTTQVKNDDDHR